MIGPDLLTLQSTVVCFKERGLLHRRQDPEDAEVGKRSAMVQASSTMDHSNQDVSNAHRPGDDQENEGEATERGG